MMHCDKIDQYLQSVFNFVCHYRFQVVFLFFVGVFRPYFDIYDIIFIFQKESDLKYCGMVPLSQL